MRPALAAPGRSGRKRTKRSTSPSIPNRPASVAANAIPASETTRSSSNATPHTIQSDRPVIVHHQGDLLTPGPGCPYSLEKPHSGGHSYSRIGRNQPSSAVDLGSEHNYQTPTDTETAYYTTTEPANLATASHANH